MESKSRREQLRFLAADVMRHQGYEVYTLPVTGVEFIPHMVAYKDKRFYNVYIFENAEERYNFLSGDLGKHIFEYADIMGAVVTTVSLKVMGKSTSLM